MTARKPYPSDVSEEEWALVAPYLCLLREDASQRNHSLREVFNGLRYVVKSGAPWRWMPNDLPPWAAVYQQARRWLAAGCFEALASDLRAVLRLAAGRAEVAGYGGDLIDDTVATVEPGFRVRLAGGDTLEARRVLVATGLRDELPDIPGLRERFGRRAVAATIRVESDRREPGVIVHSSSFLRIEMASDDRGPRPGLEALGARLTAAGVI